MDVQLVKSAESCGIKTPAFARPWLRKTREFLYLTIRPRSTAVIIGPDKMPKIEIKTAETNTVAEVAFTRVLDPSKFPSRMYIITIGLK